MNLEVERERLIAERNRQMLELGLITQSEEKAQEIVEPMTPPASPKNIKPVTPERVSARLANKPRTDYSIKDLCRVAKKPKMPVSVEVKAVSKLEGRIMLTMRMQEAKRKEIRRKIAEWLPKRNPAAESIVVDIDRDTGLIEKIRIAPKRRYTYTLSATGIRIKAVDYFKRNVGEPPRLTREGLKVESRQASE